MTIKLRLIHPQGTASLRARYDAPFGSARRTVPLWLNRLAGYLGYTLPLPLIENPIVGEIWSLPEKTLIFPYPVGHNGGLPSRRPPLRPLQGRKSALRVERNSKDSFAVRSG